MPVLALTDVAALLSALLLGMALQGSRGANTVVYPMRFIACVALLGVACSELLAARDFSPSMVLPIPNGMPMVVEISVAFSVIVAFIVMDDVFLFRIRERFDSVASVVPDPFRGERP
jgi:hypothetical protein